MQAVADLCSQDMGARLYACLEQACSAYIQRLLEGLLGRWATARDCPSRPRPFAVSMSCKTAGRVGGTGFLTARRAPSTQTRPLAPHCSLTPDAVAFLEHVELCWKDHCEKMVQCTQERTAGTPCFAVALRGGGGLLAA